VSAHEPSSPGDADRGVRVLTALVWGLAGVLSLLSLWVVVDRFRYPVDGEWMTGAVREGIARIRDGKQLYVAPSAHFIPFVYTPLYLWLAAQLARVCSPFVAAKLVSIAATFAAGFGIHRIAVALGASRKWARYALVLHLATYPLTILFYDLERVDASYAAMIVLGVAVLLTRKSTAGALVAGALLGGAFFAKQAGLFAFAAALVGLVLAGERRRAMLVGAAGIVVLGVFGTLLELRSGGWFHYYCLVLPRAHGIKAARLSILFIQDVPKAFAYAAGSVAMTIPVAWSFLRTRTRPTGTSADDVVFASVLGAGMAGAFVFRAHAGGWENVLVAWLPLGCVAAAVAASRAETRARALGSSALVEKLLLGGLCLQLLAAMFDPAELSPNAEDLAERQRLTELVRDLEREGEVLVTITGEITREPSPHAAALYDIVRAGDAAPRDLLEGLAARRFAALLVGTPDEFECPPQACTDLVLAIGRHYFVAGRRHERKHNGMTGYDGRPRWIMRPRKQPLPPSSLEELYRRQRVEMGLAEAESGKVAFDVEVHPVDAIEDRAERVLAGELPNQGK